MFLFSGSRYISNACWEQANLPESGSKYLFILNGVRKNT